MTDDLSTGQMLFSLGKQFPRVYTGNYGNNCNTMRKADKGISEQGDRGPASITPAEVSLNKTPSPYLQPILRSSLGEGWTWKEEKNPHREQYRIALHYITGRDNWWMRSVSRHWSKCLHHPSTFQRGAENKLPLCAESRGGRFAERGRPGWMDKEEEEIMLHLLWQSKLKKGGHYFYLTRREGDRGLFLARSL